jgi:Cysteine-rich secretory protein family
MPRWSIALLIWTLSCPGFAAAYGESSGGYPTMDELWVEVYTSSARQDPAAWGWPSYSKCPALWRHDGLNVVARNHSADMAQNGCWSHDSCDGTDWADRIMEYYDTYYIGENIAAGQSSPWEAVDGWLHSSGHRENIYTCGYQEIGTGVASGGYYGIYWTQDFGGGAPAVRHPVPTAAAGSNGGQVEIWAILETSQSPVEVMVGFDGECHQADLIYGDAGAGTYEALATSGSPGRWNIQVRLGGSEVHFWPDTGSWSAGGYSADPPLADCFGVNPGDDDDAGDDDAGDDDAGDDDGGDDDAGDDDGPPGSDDDSTLTDGGGISCAGSGSPFATDSGAGTALLGLFVMGGLLRRRLLL